MRQRLIGDDVASFLVILIFVAFGTIASTNADPEPTGTLPSHEPAPVEREAVRVERIVVLGASLPTESAIRRTLEMERVIEPTRENLERLEARIVGLGLIDSVDIRMRPVPSREGRGVVAMTVHVVERSSRTIDHIWFGASSIAPGYGGLQLTDTNVAGSHFSLTGGVAAARASRAPQSRAQFAGEVLLQTPSWRKVRWALGLSAARSSEHHRVSNSRDGNDGADQFVADALDRGTILLGARTGGASCSNAMLAGTATTGRSERSNVDVLGGIASLTCGNARGSFQFDAEFGKALTARARGYFVGSAEIDRVWPFFDGSITTSAKLMLSTGTPPPMVAIEKSDVTPLSPPRVLGMAIARKSTPRWLRAESEARDSGNLALSASLEYAHEVRSHKRSPAIAFVRSGIFSIGNRSAWGDDPANESLTTDIFIDAGARFEIRAKSKIGKWIGSLGVLELSISSIRGRTPW